MKRKWIIMGDEKKFMREVFQLSDNEVDEVKRFMEQEFHSVPELMKLLIKSSLNDKQKMLASYVMGNTVGSQVIQDMRNTTQDSRPSMIPDMAG